jgi:phosphoribosylformimino-5-aminoimidazole carboxamide ribotide isomerase
MRIIPAIDLIDGKCVRLSQGDYAQKTIYNENPLQVAQSFEAAGLKYLHLVDLDGAKAGAVTNWNVVNDITRNTKLTVDFGGGVKTQDELSKLFDLGVHQVNLGSIAVKNSKLVSEWIELFGADKIILSADVKNEQIQINGWMDKSDLSISSLTKKFIGYGIKYITCTDIHTDGMLQGPNVTLYSKLIGDFPTTRWIASGGVAKLADLDTLKATGVDGVIIGKAIYEGKIKLEELTTYSC